MSEGDEPNPWPAGIAETTWWFCQRCEDLGGSSAGIYANKPGFHNFVTANQQNWPLNYSVNPNIPELIAEPVNKARAFDWMFPEAQTKNYVRINVYCQRLMDASLAHDPRLRGLYEWFGTRDGANIGYNVWKDRFSSSDDSHDWHIHFSFVTAYLLIWAGVQGLLSVLKGETLAAYLAGGGQLIGENPMTTVNLNPEDPEWSAVKWRQYAMFMMRERTEHPRYPEDVPLVIALNKLIADVAELKANAGGPVAVNMSSAQIVALGNQIASGVLEPLADASDAYSDSLRTAVGAGE